MQIFLPFSLEFVLLVASRGIILNASEILLFSLKLLTIQVKFKVPYVAFRAMSALTCHSPFLPVLQAFFGHAAVLFPVGSLCFPHFLQGSTQLSQSGNPSVVAL